MRNSSRIKFLVITAVMTTAFFLVPTVQGAASEINTLLLVRPNDSLRTGAVLKEMKALVTILQDSIQPQLKGDLKKDLKERTASLKKLLKVADTQFRDTMLTDFSKLSDAEKTNLREMEMTVSGIKNALPEKSVHFHWVALAHLPVYRAVQEMQPEAKIPLLSTYAWPYDPNTTSNNQVIMVGAYLNFYLEYRIKVGGIEMGPDIVDPERLVFTFPEKLLAGITEPTFIEVKAAPKKRTGSGKSARFEDHPEQHTYILVYPKKTR